MIKLILGLLTVSLFTITILPLSAVEGQEIMMKKLVEMINKRRASGGTCGEIFFRPSRPVRWDRRLASAAYIHASEMAFNERLSFLYNCPILASMI